MSSILSERHKHSSEQASILLRKIAEEIVKDRNKDLQELDTVDIRGKGRLDKSLIKYNDERFAFRRKILLSKNDYELPFEPNTKYLQLWYMMDHLGQYITDISNNGLHGLLEGRPTLTLVPIDLGFEHMPEEPRSIATNFNTGTDSISELEGELIVTDNYPRLRHFTNTALYPTTKLSIMFRFYSTDWTADDIGGGSFIFRRFSTKRDDADNGFALAFDEDGDVCFHVYDTGVWYKRKIDNLLLNAYYDVVCTYDETAGATAADRIKMYWHRTLQAVQDPVVRQDVDDANTLVLPPTTELKHFVGGRSLRDGYFKGILQDYREYHPINTVPSRQVLTPTQVKNWFTNRLTIENTAFGNVSVVGFFNVADNDLNNPYIPFPLVPAMNRGTVT